MFRLIPAVAIIIALYVAEAFLIFIEDVPYMVPLPPMWWQAKYHERSYDQRNEHMTLADAAHEGVTVFPQVPPLVWINGRDAGYFERNLGFLPLSFRPNATSFCNESGEWVGYFTNNLGFRKLAHSDPAPYSQATKVVIVGDSYAFGTCVEASSSIGGVINDSGFIVKSYALPGTGPLFHYASFVEYGRHDNPDFLVWHFYINDLRDVLGEQNNETMANYLDMTYSQDLIDKSDMIALAQATYFDEKLSRVLKEVSTKQQENDALIRWIEGTEVYLDSWRNKPFMRYVKLWRVRTRVLGQKLVPASNGPFGRFGDLSKDALGDSLEVLDRVLGNVANLARQDGMRVIFSYQPVWESYNNFSSSWEKVKVAVQEMVLSHGIEFVDAFDGLSANQMKKYYPFGLKSRLHSNEAGYTRIAEAIVRRIRCMENSSC